MDLIYLAGFDVFRPDAVARGQYLKELCSKQGMLGMYPFDNEVPDGLEPHAMASLICQKNMEMIRNCTAVLANLNVFRGMEPDSGTVFEVGMAIALRKPVWAYFEPTGTLRELVPHDAQGRDANGYHVEDFGLPRNLMLSTTWAGSSPTPEEAVLALKNHLRTSKEAARMRHVGCEHDHRP